MKKNIIKTINNVKNISKLVKINILVIGGGGMKGLEYIGALKYLDELNILKNIKEYYGCSIGSYINLLLVLNYSIDDIINFVINFDFSMIVDTFNNMFNNYGFGKSDMFINIIKNKIKIKNYDTNITFKELYDINNINFNVIGYNITKKNKVIINHLSYPNMKVWEGIYLSCAMPILFKPLLYENEYYCDGGTSDNCPINIIPLDKQKNTICISSNIFDYGIQIDPFIKNKNINNFITYIYELFYLYCDKEKYKRENYKNVIWLENYDKFSMVKFHYNKDDKIILIRKGYILCKKKY